MEEYLDGETYYPDKELTVPGQRIVFEVGYYKPSEKGKDLGHFEIDLTKKPYTIKAIKRRK